MEINTKKEKSAQRDAPRQAVVEEDGAGQVVGDLNLDAALGLVVEGDEGIFGAVNIKRLGRRIARAVGVIDLVFGDLYGDRVSTRAKRGGASGITHSLGREEEPNAETNKYNANHEKRRKHARRRQNGLPRLQPLLLERGACEQRQATVSNHSDRKGMTTAHWTASST